MDKIKSFKDLVVWRESRSLALEIYKITAKFPSDEKFGLINQLRRASISVSSCIAEGFSRKTNRDKLNFYRMASGSLTELDSQLMIAHDLGFMNDKTYLSVSEQITTVGKLITGISRATREGRYKPYPEN
jgi:four helix bundle protein